MNSSEQYELEQVARALAKRFIYRYVERGDSFESTVTVTLDGRSYNGCGKALH